MGTDGVTYTPGGLAWGNEWGSLRFVGNAAMIASVYAKNVQGMSLPCLVSGSSTLRPAHNRQPSCNVTISACSLTICNLHVSNVDIGCNSEQRR